MRERKYSLREIAKALSRSVSTISEEIKRNKVNGKYDPIKASHKSYVRRKNSKYQAMSIVLDKVLRKRVDELLYDDVSPENISGRLRKEGLTTSKDSIYRYIKSIYGRKIEYYRAKFKWKNRSKVKLEKLKDRINISKRPKVVNTRSRFGDTEADFIVSGRGGTGILLVLIDRKTRRVFIRKITKVSIQNVHKSLFEIKELFPEIKTLTLDNDILFKKHLELKELLRVKIYFCTPYHSWEKGSVENANRCIRKYIKKRSDISLYTNEYIKEVEDKLNRRPMKCLDYSTPHELFTQNQNKKKPGRA